MWLWCSRLGRREENDDTDSETNVGRWNRWIVRTEQPRWHIDVILVERPLIIYGISSLFLFSCFCRLRSNEMTSRREIVRCISRPGRRAAIQPRDLGKVAVKPREQFKQRRHLSTSGPHVRSYKSMPVQCLALDLKDLSVSTPLLDHTPRCL